MPYWQAKFLHRVDIYIFYLYTLLLSMLFYIGYWTSGLIDIDISHWITYVCRPLISTIYSYQFQCFPRAHLIIFNEICYHSHSSSWSTYSFPHETHYLTKLVTFSFQCHNNSPSSAQQERNFQYCFKGHVHSL